MMTSDVMILPLMEMPEKSEEVHFATTANHVPTSHLFIGKQRDAYV